MQRRLFLKLSVSSVAGNVSQLSAADNAKTRLAFGCCNRVHLPQKMWSQIEKYQPELFLWLGDCVYANTTNTDTMQALFQRQFNQADYARFRTKIPVIGIWDDHDYGGNNLGKENPVRRQSQQLFLDFLEEPPQSPRRQQQGIYTSYVLGKGDRQIKLLLLDGRFHRDTSGTGRADTLGETQWNWLEQELKHSTAKVHLIASGYSVLSTQIPGAEEWSDFKWAKKRLFNLLRKYNNSGVLFLTGDRHFAAHLSEKVQGLLWHEFMSSGLTHYLFRPNVSRVLRAYYGPHNSYFGRNFGLLDIDWQDNPHLTFRAMDKHGQQQLEIKLTLKDRLWTA